MLDGVSQAFTVTFLSLFPIMNPIGGLAPFVAMTDGSDIAARRRQALMTGVWVFLLLAVFALA